MERFPQTYSSPPSALKASPVGISCLRVASFTSGSGMEKEGFGRPCVSTSNTFTSPATLDITRRL
ncbi:MAG: hypothetical protein U1F77_19000 [Kiritimatiellia bacterium]